MSDGVDIEAVSRLIAEAAATIVMPRFRHLGRGDVEDKSPSSDRADLVTIADREAEAWLTAALVRLDPGSTVIGEEAVYATPGLLDRLKDDAPVWLIDPIDGTRNFVHGDDGFGVMVARVVGGRAQAAWVLLPARGQAFAAETGSGAWLNGARIRVPAIDATGPLRGSLFTRYMPADVRARVTTGTTDGIELFADSSCAAVEYTDTVRGAKDFLVYYRLLPWDHAAPALILTEAGGRVEHVDGQPYTARSSSQITIVAGSQSIADEIGARLGRN
ncbi:MAG: hypothetical protein ABS36_09785 [Acidobacteria bacterium SCN 69-37]|nr:MAG: hypothetical protein ABS36_09785 [Acidobacteria bacterium SCN 69-37]